MASGGGLKTKIGSVLWPSTQRLDSMASDEHNTSYFGELANPDPTDDSPIVQKGTFLDLVIHSRRVIKQYGKVSKQRLLADAVSLSRGGLFLGKKVPKYVEKHFHLFSKDTKNKNKWSLPQIADPLYHIGQHV